MGVGGLLSWMRDTFPGSFGGAGGRKRGRADDDPAANLLIDANSLVHDAVMHFFIDYFLLRQASEPPGNAPILHSPP